MKTKEELNALKNEVEALNKKLAELSEDELKRVGGGFYAGNTGFEDWGNLTLEELKKRAERYGISNPDDLPPEDLAKGLGLSL